MKPFVALTLASLAIGCLAGDVFAQSAPTVTMDQALTIAQKGSNGFTLVYGRFETGVIWGFYFITPEGFLIEKEVSGITGKIVKDKVVQDIKNKPKPKVDNKVVELVQGRALTKMSLSRLLEIADENGVSPPNGFDVSNQGNQLLVTITGPNGTIVLDLVTGQVVSKK